MKLGEIQFLKNIPVRESLFMVGKTDFPASEKHFFFLHFSETPVSFFPSVKKAFFNEKQPGSSFSGNVFFNIFQPASASGFSA